MVHFYKKEKWVTAYQPAKLNIPINLCSVRGMHGHAISITF